VDINIPDMLLKLRRDLEHEQDAVWQLGMKAWQFGNTHPLLFEIGGKVASAAAKAYTTATGTDKINNLPYPLSGWTEFRDFPPFAEQSFHEWWREHKDG
jgi:L-lactate dehydrogenase complex protein LldF